MINKELINPYLSKLSKKLKRMIESGKALVNNLFGKRGQSSAFTNLLWINGITTVPSLTVASYFLYNDKAGGFFFFGLATIIVLYTLYKFEWYSKNRPDDLKTEWYQLTHYRYNLVGEKNKPYELQADEEIEDASIIEKDGN